MSACLLPPFFQASSRVIGMLVPPVILHRTTLHYIALNHTTLHYTAPHHTTLHYITAHYTTPHHTTPHYITLNHTTLHHTTPHHTHHTTLHQPPFIHFFSYHSLTCTNCFLLSISNTGNVQTFASEAVHNGGTHMWHFFCLRMLPYCHLQITLLLILTH